MNNTRSIVLTGIVLSIVFVILQFIIHGVVLQDMYQQTASLWRPHDEMSHLMWLMIVGEVIFAFAFSAIYAGGFDPRKPRVGQGFRFGILMACLFAPLTALSWYVILPMPAVLSFYEFIASVVDMLVLGVVVGCVYISKK